MPIANAAKPYRGLAMEGAIARARWYAKTTARSNAFRDEARRLATRLPPSADVLEVAPGPGYLAVELANLGSFRVTGLDISRSFVEIARENAARAGLSIDFCEGNASAMPFGADKFDAVLCRAAFKNFSDPVGALAEMHRVLRPGGVALILDLRKDATAANIASEVETMNLGPVSRFMTRATLRSLRKRAYARGEFEKMIAATPFGRGEIEAGPIGFEIKLVKPASH
jgi:ubiquinone/menaquinone biosynthesis C-methylase UbiE